VYQPEQILGAWLSSDKSNVSLKEILEKSRQSQPSYINSRYYTELADTETKKFLDKLGDKNTSPEAYRSVMFKLGVKLGNSILKSINSQSNVAILNENREAL
jgi:hypothetical protein